MKIAASALPEIENLIPPHSLSLSAHRLRRTHLLSMESKSKNALLQFDKVVNTKEQVVAGTMYYITLEATDGGKKKVYEAKVWVKPWMNFKEVQEFKSLGDAPSEGSST